MKNLKKFKLFLKKSAQGLVSGGADNDPSGISTYSIAGATFGYSFLWLMILILPMLVSVQAMCARLGDLKRKGLTEILKERYPLPIVWFSALILLLANTATIGADIAGMAYVLGFITNTFDFIWVFPIAGFIWYVVVFKNYKTIEKYLLWLTAVFLSYILAAFLARPNWLEIGRAIILPTIRLTTDYFLVALAVMGTTISPFLFFWQSKEQVEDGRPKKLRLLDAKEEGRTLAPGFTFAIIIAIFIMISTGTVLFKNNLTQITSAAEAALALEPLAGKFAMLLFSLGILGAGFLAVPIIATSTAYAVSEVLGWRDSLSDDIVRARGFYAVITVSLLVGVAIVFLPINPIKALFYSQVLNGILTPFLILIVLFLCNNRKVVGQYVNGWFDNLFGILAVFIMFLSSIGLFWQTFS